MLPAVYCGGQIPNIKNFAEALENHVGCPLFLYAGLNGGPSRFKVVWSFASGINVFIWMIVLTRMRCTTACLLVQIAALLVDSTTSSNSTIIFVRR